MRITPNQKKSFHDTLVAVDIDWGQFEEVIIPKTEDHGEYPRLVHKPTELFFGFYHNEIFESLYPQIGGWYVEFSPGEGNRPLSSHPTVNGWEGVMKLFKVWSDLMKKEIGAYDFLDQLNKFTQDQTKNKGLYDNIKEEKFEKEEEDFIKNQLIEFGQKI